MTIDEAIKHCEEVADGLTEQGKCAECAAEHRQLAEWLRNYKRLKEQEPCEEAISRQAVLDMMQMRISGKELYKAVYDLPSVTPQPKTGRWMYALEDWNKWECSECGFTKRTDVHVSIGYKFCPKCGTKMI